jgi:hypothetical protein
MPMGEEKFFLQTSEGLYPHFFFLRPYLGQSLKFFFGSNPEITANNFVEHHFLWKNFFVEEKPYKIYCFIKWAFNL